MGISLEGSWLADEIEDRKFVQIIKNSRDRLDLPGLITEVFGKYYSV